MPALPRGPRAVLGPQQVMRATVYLEGDDGPVGRFDVGCVEVNIEHETDYESLPFRHGDPVLNLGVSVRTLFTLRGELRAITDGTQ